MKRYLFIIIGITFMFLTYGCTNSDEVADELIEYHNNDWLKFKNMNDEKLGPIASEIVTLIMRQEHKGVEILIKEEFLHAVSEIVDYLEGIELEHKEVQALNQLMIEVKKDSYNQFQETAKVLESGDEKKIQERFEKHSEYLDEQNEIYDNFYEKRDQLVKKYDIYWKIGRAHV